MDKVIVGKIINTHGIKGELKIFPNTDFIEERFKKGNILFIEYGDKEIEVTIKSSRIHKGNILVVFDGFHDINLVEKYKQSNLLGFKDDDLLGDGEYYYADLIDCKIMDETIGEIGTVDSIFETKAHDILVVKNDKGKETKIPYVDAFILEEDMDHKTIYVKLIEGMYDEN